MYRDRLLALPSRPPVADPDWLFEPPAGLANVVADAAMVATGDQAALWATFVGTYRRPLWGYLDPTAPPDRFVVDAGVHDFEADDPETEGLVRHRLAEVEPGLFLADNGETLDLRGPAQTWRNLRLVRVSGSPAQEPNAPSHATTPHNRNSATPSQGATATLSDPNVKTDQRET